MGGYAWVTLATNNSYSLGALVLAHSLKKANTAHKLVVLITPAVSQPMREQLQTVFDLVKVVDVLDSKDEAHLALMKRPDLGITFTKIHCWRLVEFEKCVFLDADTLVVRNCDELFEKEEFSAAPDVSWPDCFNSGVFVYRPSVETFNKLLQFAVENRSFDGMVIRSGDQGLLNQFFSDWATEDIKKHLPFVYNLTTIAAYSYIPAFKHYGSETRIVHFIGSGKPWLQQLDAATRTITPTSGSEHLAPLLQQWWDLFCEKVHPNLDKNLESSNDGMSQPPVEARSNFLPIALTDEPQTALLVEPCTPYREKDDFRQHNLPYLPFHVKGPAGELLNVEFLSASVVPPQPESSKEEQQRQEKPEENEKIEKEESVRDERQNEKPENEPKEEVIEEKVQVEEKEPAVQQQEEPPPKDPFDYHSFFPDETCISSYLEKNVVTYQPFDHHEQKHTKPEPERSSPSLPRFLTIPQNDQRQSGNTDTQPESSPPARIEPQQEKEATPPREVEPVNEKRELSKSKSMSCFPMDVGTVGDSPPRTSIWKSQPNLNVDPNRRYSMPRLKPILPKQKSFSKSVPSEIPKVTLYTEFLISSEYKDPVGLPKDKIGFVETHLHREGKLRRSKSDADIRDKFGPLPYVPSPEVEIPAAPKRMPRLHFDNDYYDLAKCKRQMGNKPKPKDAEKRKENALPALKPIVPAKNKKSTLIKKRKSKELSPGDGGREKIPKREAKKVRERKRESAITPRNVSTENGNNLEEILQRLREFSKNYQHFFGPVAKPKPVTCKNATVQASEEEEGECGSSEPFETFTRSGSTRKSRETQTPRKTSAVESSEFRQFRNYVKDQKETSQRGLLSIQDILSEARDGETVLNSIENKAPALKGGSCQKWENSPKRVRDGDSTPVKETEKQMKISKPEGCASQTNLEEVKTNSEATHESSSKTPKTQPNDNGKSFKSWEIQNGQTVVPQMDRQSPANDVNKLENPAVVLESQKDIPIKLQQATEGNQPQKQDEIVQGNNKTTEDSVVETTKIATTAQQGEVVELLTTKDDEPRQKTPSSHSEKKTECPDSEKQDEILNTNSKSTKVQIVATTTTTPQQPKVEENYGEQRERPSGHSELKTGGADSTNQEKQAEILNINNKPTAESIVETAQPQDVVKQNEGEMKSIGKQDEIVNAIDKAAEEIIEETAHITQQQEEAAGRLVKNDEQEERKASSHPEITAEGTDSEEEEGIINANSRPTGVMAEMTQIPKNTQEEVVKHLAKNDDGRRKETPINHFEITAEGAKSKPAVGKHPTAVSLMMQKTSNGHKTPLLKTKVNVLKNAAGVFRPRGGPTKKKAENRSEIPKNPEEILCVPDFDTPRTSRVSPPNASTAEAVRNGGSNGLDDSPVGAVRFFGKGKSGCSSSSPSPSPSPSPGTPRCGNGMSESFEDLKSKSGIAGAIAQLNLEGGAGQRPEGAASTAHEEYLRRQNWETGNMDYMGRDSFDNIWSKICQTIEAKELEEKAAGSPQPSTESPKPSEKLTEPTELPATLERCPEYIETLPGEPAAGPVEDDEIIFSKPENRQSCLTNIVEEEETGMEGMAGRSVKLSDILKGGGSTPGQTVPNAGGEKVEEKTEGKGTSLSGQEKLTGGLEKPACKTAPSAVEPQKNECKTVAVTPQPPPAVGQKELEVKQQPESEKTKAEASKPQPTPTETKPQPTPTETKPQPTPTETKPQPTPTETKPQPTPTETKPQPTPTETKPQPTPTETKPQPEPQKTECTTIATAPQPTEGQKQPEAALGGQPPSPAPQPECKTVAIPHPAVGQTQPEPEKPKLEPPKPQPTAAEGKTVPTALPTDGQKQPEPEKKTEECKTVAIPSPPINFPGSPLTDKPPTKTEEKKPEVTKEPIPLPPPETRPPQEPTTQTKRSESPKEEGKQRKGVFSKILEIVGVAPKEKNGSDTPKSVFYDVEPKPEGEKKTEEVGKSPEGSTEGKESVSAVQSDGQKVQKPEAPIIPKPEEQKVPKPEEQKVPKPEEQKIPKPEEQKIPKPEEQKVPKPEEQKVPKQEEPKASPEKPGQAISKPARSSSPKESKQPSDSIQVSPTRKSPSPKLKIPPKLPETEVTMPTPPPQPEAPPRRNSALLKVDDTILETPPVVESKEESVKGKVTTEIEDIIGKAKSEVESLLQDRRSAEKEAGGEGSDLINTMKLLMGGDQPGKSGPEEVEELRVTTEEERKRHKGEVVTSKLSDQILKAIPPPRRKAISEASASTSAIPKAAAEQKTDAGESKAKPSKPSAIPVPPPRSRGKPTTTPAPSKPKGKK